MSQFTSFMQKGLHLGLGDFSILFATVALLLVYILHLQRRKPKGYPPGPPSLPFIGNLHQLGTHPFKAFMSMRKKYGDIFSVDFASVRGVVINEPKLIREMLGLAEFSGRPKLRPFLERNGKGDKRMRGLVFHDGAGALELRRFASRHLKDFGLGRKSMESIIQGEVDELMNTLAKYGSNGAPFRTKYVFNLTAVNSLWWIIVGERFAHDDQRLGEIVRMLTDGLEDSPATGAFFFFPWLSRIAPGLTGYNSFMQFQWEANELIGQKYRETKASFKTGVHRHFLDVFTEEAINCTNPDSEFYGPEGEKNLVASVTDLFLAGIETTSTTMSWAVMFLCVHPEIQEKMFGEVKSVIGISRSPNLDDEPNMPYTQAVMTEVLRYSSIVPLSIFHCTVVDVEFHGFRIPKDTMVMPNFYGAHHDPEVWGDPESFRPERFMSAEGSFSKPADGFLPFSAGKRGCIGEALARNTLFLLLVNLVQRFKIEPAPDKPKPTIDYVPSFILQTKPYEYVLAPRTRDN